MFLPKFPNVEPQLFLILIWFSGLTKHPYLLRGRFCPFAAPYAHLFLGLAIFITCPFVAVSVVTLLILLCQSGFANPVYSPWLHYVNALLSLF